MMATVSELSMRQAEALKHQQEVRQQESALEQAYLRMEQGEAPSEEVAREWERLIRDELRKKSETEERRMVNSSFLLIFSPFFFSLTYYSKLKLMYNTKCTLKTKAMKMMCML